MKREFRNTFRFLQWTKFLFSLPYVTKIIEFEFALIIDFVAFKLEPLSILIKL